MARGGRDEERSRSPYGLAGYSARSKITEATRMQDDVRFEIDAAARGDAASSRPSHRGVASFLGVYLDALTYPELIRLVDIWRRDKGGRSHHIACINAHCAVLASTDRHLARIYNSADIVGPDGMPMLRWIRRFRRLPCDRMAAPDITLVLAGAAAQHGFSLYLYGGAPDVLMAMKAFLERRYPGLRIVGHCSPPFRALTPEEDEAICRDINALAPDIVLVGLGTPKQDFWIDEHLHRIRGAVLIASGATFDFFGGRVPMAPEWIRRSGFEWLYRLLGRDFRRLWRRYTVGNVQFCWRFLLQISGVLIVPGERQSRD